MTERYYHGLRRVISGGQTGADQGGLLAAHKLRVPTGGTAPRGFMTSRGPNLLLETLGLVAKGTLQTRTKQNIQDSCGTVILSSDLSSAGTVLTIRLCQELRKAVLVLDVNAAVTQFGDTGVMPVDAMNELCETLRSFIVQNEITVLNVAGNRERFDDARTTRFTEHIVHRALLLLDADDLLFRV